MTVPSIRDFETYRQIALRSARLADDTIDSEPPTFEAVIEFLPNIWDRRRAILDELRQTPVDEWLNKQPGFERAMRAASGKPLPGSVRLASREQFVAHHTEAFRERFAKVQRLRRTYPQFVLTRMLNLRPYDLYADLAQAFQNYFYPLFDPSRARKIALTRARRVAQEVSDTVESELLPVCELDPVSSHSSSNYRQTARALAEIVEDIERRLAQTMPDSRNDKTLPERELMWALRNALLRRFSRCGATSIFHLMSFEGVRHPPDMRTIERHLKDWRKHDALRSRDRRKE